MLLPDGRTFEVEDEAVKILGEPVAATAARVARSLFGLPYRWGGSDSTQG